MGSGAGPDICGGGCVDIDEETAGCSCAAAGAGGVVSCAVTGLPPSRRGHR